MKEGLEAIKAALEEHLSSINDNTTEIQVLFDFLQDVERKVDGVSQRLDQLQVAQGTSVPQSIRPLYHEEKEIFLVMYTEEAPLTIEEISRKAGQSSAAVMECIAALSRKGIPVQRVFANDQFFFSLDKQFKERQARENIVNLSLASFM